MTTTTKSRGMVEADADLARLAELEGIIERGLQSFVEVGNAIIAIQIGKLYKLAGFDTFDTYMRERWQIGRGRGYQLMTAAATHKAIADALPEMSTAVDISPPTTERHIRAFGAIEPELAAETWMALVKKFGGIEVTSRMCEAAAILVASGDYQSAAAADWVHSTWLLKGDLVSEAREWVAPRGGPCSVCGEAVVLFDGDDRCAQCIEAGMLPLSTPELHGGPANGDARVTAGDGDTAVASPATIADPTPIPAGVDQPTAASPNLAAVTIPAPDLPQSVEPETTVGEVRPPAASSTVVTPDEVIPPKPKREKPTQREAFEDDYVRHLKRIAAAAKSWSWFADLNSLSNAQRERICDRLTEEEQTALLSLARTVWP